MALLTIRRSQLSWEQDAPHRDNAIASAKRIMDLMNPFNRLKHETTSSLLMRMVERICRDDKFKNVPQHIFYRSNIIASSKAIELLSALANLTFNTRTALYELARMIAPKNYNIAVHKSMDDDNQTDGVAMPSNPSQMRIKQMNTTKLFNAPLSATRLIYHENYRHRYRLHC